MDKNNRKIKRLTLGAERHERELLLEVAPAEELSVLDDELVPLVQAPAARHAGEAGQVEDAARRAHHQLLGRDGLHAALALGAVQPAHTDRGLSTHTQP